VQQEKTPVLHLLNLTSGPKGPLSNYQFFPEGHAPRLPGGHAIATVHAPKNSNTFLCGAQNNTLSSVIFQPKRIFTCYIEHCSAAALV